MIIVLRFLLVLSKDIISHVYDYSKVCVFLLSLLYVKVQLTPSDFEIQGSAPQQAIFMYYMIIHTALSPWNTKGLT